jgi:hypothetical protein
LSNKRSAAARAYTAAAKKLTDETIDMPRRLASVTLEWLPLLELFTREKAASRILLTPSSI